MGNACCPTDCQPGMVPCREDLGLFVVSPFVEDTFSAKVPLHSQDFGVRVFDKVRLDGFKVLHTTVHDR